MKTLTFKYPKWVKPRFSLTGDTRLVSSKSSWIPQVYNGYTWINENKASKRLKSLSDTRRSIAYQSSNNRGK